MMLAPLGIAPRLFFFDPAACASLRRIHGIALGTPIAVMSGKLHGCKRVVDVVKACRASGVRLVLVGTFAEKLRDEIARLPPGGEILLQQVEAGDLRGIYSMADIAIFTTFTISYWEAHATGIKMVIPNTAFSRLVFEGDADVLRFGEPSMFAVEDEEYRPHVAIEGMLAEGLERAKESLRSGLKRASRLRFSAAVQAAALSELYQRVTQRMGGAT